MKDIFAQDATKNLQTYTMRSIIRMNMPTTTSIVLKQHATTLAFSVVEKTVSGL